MKKIITVLCFLLVSLSLFQTQIVSADCEYNEDWSVSQNLDNCLADSALVNPWDGLIEWGVKNKIIYWTWQLATVLSLISIGAVVYGAGLMTVSMWDDEKIKKWKDVIKWAILWFLWLLVAGALVRIVIELMFSVAS